MKYAVFAPFGSSSKTPKGEGTDYYNSGDSPLPVRTMGSDHVNGSATGIVNGITICEHCQDLQGMRMMRIEQFTVDPESLVRALTELVLGHCEYLTRMTR